jgi:hypothetical protein
MRLEWAIPCGSATLSDEGRITAVEDFWFDTIWLDPFPPPGPLQLVLLVKAAGLPEDFAEDADRSVEAYLYGPGMDVHIAIEFELPSGAPGPEYREGWELTAVFPVVIEFTPRDTGNYSVEFYVSHRVQRRPTSVPLVILAGPAPSSPDAGSRL